MGNLEFHQVLHSDYESRQGKDVDESLFLLCRTRQDEGIRGSDAQVKETGQGDAADIAANPEEGKYDDEKGREQGNPLAGNAARVIPVRGPTRQEPAEQGIVVAAVGT